MIFAFLVGRVDRLGNLLRNRTDLKTKKKFETRKPNLPFRLVEEFRFHRTFVQSFLRSTKTSSIKTRRSSFENLIDSASIETSSSKVDREKLRRFRCSPIRLDSKGKTLHDSARRFSSKRNDSSRIFRARG